MLGLDVLVNLFGVPLDEISKVGGEIATGLKTARALFSIMPPGQGKGARSKQERRDAYLGLLVATGDLMTWHNYLGAIALAMLRWEPFAWRHTTTAIYQAAEARKSMSGFLAALSEIRLVGKIGRASCRERVSDTV